MYLVLGDGVPGTQGNATVTKIFEVLRDYTMYDRAEAPQQYPPVQRRQII